MKHSFKKFIGFMILIAVLIGTLAACGEENAGMEKDNKRTAQAMDQYTSQVPVPQYSFPWVRYVVKQIMDAQQAGVSTFTYVYNPFLGIMRWSCNSLGYPIPGGTQMTSPDQVIDRNEGDVVVAQAEPSGVYPPETAAATMILCVDVEGRTFVRYEEDYVTTVPFPVQIIDGVEVPLEGYDPSFTIDTTKK